MTFNQSIFFRQQGHRDGDIRYKTANYMSQNKSNLIKRTIRDTNNTTKKYLKLTNELGYGGP